MSNLETLTAKYKDNLEKAQKEREALIQRVNQIGSLIDQLNGALYALNEAAGPEQLPPTEEPKAE